MSPPPSSGSALVSPRTSPPRASPSNASRSADNAGAPKGKGRARKVRSSSPRLPPGPEGVLPAVDERLVMPGTRFEIINGRVVDVPPSDEAHGTRHSKLSAVLEAYVGASHMVASDMLTRTSKHGDMAPDASVFPLARDPETGGRKLEELAFEVVSTERLGDAALKARELSKRGVRRIFAIDVERRRALEWSRPTDTWEILSRDASIEDPTLAAPLPLRALVEAMRADDAMAVALLAKKNAVIEAALAESRAQGHAQGHAQGQMEGRLRSKQETLFAILKLRGVEVTKSAEKKIRGETEEGRLDGWIRRALQASSVKEVLKG